MEITGAVHAGSATADDQWCPAFGPAGFLAGAIVELWVALRLNWV